MLKERFTFYKVNDLSNNLKCKMSFCLKKVISLHLVLVYIPLPDILVFERSVMLIL